MSKIEIIVATDLDHGIAKDGRIPWHYPEDLAHFRGLTEDAILIMGRVTWETLPNPFKRRHSIVLSRKPRDVTSWWATSQKEKVVRIALASSRPVYVIGGEQIYKLFMPYVSLIIQTCIPERFNCDQFFRFGSGSFALSGEYALPTTTVGRINHKAPVVRIYKR